MAISRRSILTATGGALLATRLPRPARAADSFNFHPPAPITYDYYSIAIGGQRTYLWCGEFHYFRLPSPSLWLDVLQKFKAAGFNAVSIYFDWGFHSPSPGSYDFTGVRDVDLLMQIAAFVGLYVVARPGPYISAEVDLGGFPGWLLNQPAVARTDAPLYLASAREWYGQINAILARHQVTQGGALILYQIENEYAFVSHDGVHTDPPAEAIAYMQALESKARADGIVVPLTHNDKGRHDAWKPGSPGGVDIYGFDSYPGSTSSSRFNTVPDWIFERQLGATSTPLYMPECQGGYFDTWGGHGYTQIRADLAGGYLRCLYKNNIAAGMTMQSFYMLFGGTSWGWLPFDTGYTSYDYGAAITESRQLTSTYQENKRIGYFVRAVAPINQTNQLADIPGSSSAIRIRAMGNPVTGTLFLTLIHADTTAATDDSTRFALATADGNYPLVPQQGAVPLNGHDAKILVAAYDLGHQRLVYTTSEILTHAPIGARDVAVLYGRPGEPGETVWRLTGEPVTTIESGTASIVWDAERSDLRLDYIHGGNIVVAIAPPGGTKLLLVITDDDGAAAFWRADSFGVAAILVQGPALLRSATALGPALLLTGDTSAVTPIEIFAAPTDIVYWNEKPVATLATAYGTLRATLAGPVAPAFGTLTGWRTRFETPERLPDFDDARWLAAANTTTANPKKPPAGQDVLYADDYGYHFGDVWYRGRFTAAGTETGITLTGGNGTYGGFSVWLNGTHLGDSNTGTASFVFPAGVLLAGANVVSVLAENLGHPNDGGSNDGYKVPRGLLAAGLEGGDAPIAWRIQGALGGETPVDPVRGVFNNGGLFGERSGWHLPGFPDGDWQAASLPAAQPVPGIAWYRTALRLSLPAGQDSSVGLQITDDTTRIYRARIFVNGWHMGLYINELGPQRVFVIPNGILDPSGSNTVAIAVWSFGDGSGGLGQIALVDLGTVAGGVPVVPVASPAYDASRYSG